MEVIPRLATVFEALGIPYYIGGSIASSAWGEQRLTADVDFVAHIQAHQVEALVATLESEFYIDDQMILDAIQHRSSFNVIHLASMSKADIFIPPDSPWTRSEMARRTQVLSLAATPQTLVFYASPEDTILRKLDWYRLGGEVSDRQWRDISGIFKTRPKELDLDYLRRWAAEADLTLLLERVMDEAGLLPE